MNFIIKTYLLSVAAFIPIAAGAVGVGNLNQLISTFGSLLNAVIPLIIGLAVVIFLYGIIKYITAGSDEEKRDEGRNTMIYGVIAIFVMVSVWGLINILEGTFDLNEGDIKPPQIPTFNTQ